MPSAKPNRAPSREAIQITLSSRVGETAHERRCLAARVLTEWPRSLDGVTANEFLGWIAGTKLEHREALLEAAAIRAGTKLPDLNDRHRFALVGALRLRRRAE
jgi:hypothetical protein